MTIPRGFTRCDECEDGRQDGRAWLKRMGFVNSGVDADTICRSCSGSGLLPTEKLREEAVQAAFAVSAAIAEQVFGNSLRWEQVSEGIRDEFYARADAVLRKVAEHLGDRE